MNPQEALEKELNNCSNVFEFAEGQEDARKGKPAQNNASESYNQGYNFEYTMDEVRSAGLFN